MKQFKSASIRRLVDRFVSSETGATSLEYVLMIATLAIALIGGARTIAPAIEGVLICLGEVVRDGGGLCN